MNKQLFLLAIMLSIVATEQGAANMSPCEGIDQTLPACPGVLELKPHRADKKKPTNTWYWNVRDSLKENNFDQLEKEFLKYPREDISFCLDGASTPEMVRFLVKKGADVRQKCIADGLFISSIIKQRSDLGEEKILGLVKELLIFGADPRATVGAYNESSPIHWAAIYGYSTIIAELLRNGVPVDSTAFQKERTPLHLACYTVHLEAIKTLVEAGADRWCKDSEEIAPFGYIEDCFDEDRTLQRKSIVTYMLNLLGEQVFTRTICSFGRTLFGEACTVKSYCLPLYLERAPKEFLRNFKDRFDEGTVLHVIAAMNGEKYPEEVKKSLAIALAKGVDCNAKDKKGNTPLHCALGAGKNSLGLTNKNVLFVQKLLEYRDTVLWKSRK